MNNLTQNFKIILKELTNLCVNIPTQTQIRKPKLSDLELVSLNLTAEYMSLNYELQLFRYLKDTVLDLKLNEVFTTKGSENYFLTQKK